MPTMPGVAGPRGFPITLTRGPTSSDRLRIDWDFPVHVPDANAHTVVTVLDYGDAIQAIAGGDPRPLLVLRDCLSCQGKDHAILSDSRVNDRTFVLTSWFHCVKLPANVTATAHPFHALFDGKPKSHLFLCLADGSGRVDLDGGRSQSQLWTTLVATLKTAYADDVSTRTRQMMELLDQFDRVDADITRLVEALDDELEDHGADTRRALKLRKELEEASILRQDLLARERELHAAEIAKAAAAEAEAKGSGGG